MNPADTTTAVVAYLALFAGVGFAFIFVNLLVGRFLRPADPHPEKLEIYECGEPTIGSSFVQSDLRFYVVALVFIIFDVEVAFLFPWATVFGKAQALADPRLPIVAVAEGTPPQMTQPAQYLFRELGVRGELSVPATGASETTRAVRRAGRQLMQLSIAAVAFFFVVLLIGFAYEWRSGALDWVRALTSHRGPPSVDRVAPMRRSAQESVLSA
jgi:NADH-quinone oxidoreductase subunit A